MRRLEFLLTRETTSIIRAIRRFIGRRGTPRQIYSDREEAFVRLSREVRLLRQQLAMSRSKVELGIHVGLDL